MTVLSRLNQENFNWLWWSEMTITYYVVLFFIFKNSLCTANCTRHPLRTFLLGNIMLFFTTINKCLRFIQKQKQQQQQREAVPMLLQYQVLLATREGRKKKKPVICCSIKIRPTSITMMTRLTSSKCYKGGAWTSWSVCKRESERQREAESLWEMLWEKSIGAVLWGKKLHYPAACQAFQRAVWLN